MDIEVELGQLSLTCAVAAFVVLFLILLPSCHVS